MKYLLDTNQIVNFLRNKKNTVEKLIPLFKVGVAANTITVAEYLQGVYQSSQSRKNKTQFLKFLQAGRVKILPIDWQTADMYGKLQADFEKKGKRIPSFDLLIASTAIANNLTLVSDDKIFTQIKYLHLLK